eukprot:CAMPEP_0168839186 /NCGR_PEP_ID=MMETSP0727-20121128/6026_1 /TAXON_ID=265536 /ORGANISM="Amphiprora sp., Strain CCMP467" /LENGTH=355 /DNA_ID=CAMNT_0008892659 /DNA_START=97 /DNA_END=1164 /DNA_ORIENTATION=-
MAGRGGSAATRSADVADLEEMIRSLFLVVTLAVITYVWFPYETFRKKRLKLARKAVKYYEALEDATVTWLSRCGFKVTARRLETRVSRSRRRRQGTLDRPQRPTFGTLHQKTLAYFTPVDNPPNRQPDYKSAAGWFWNVNDESVIRASADWSNQGRTIDRAGNWWVLEPEYYDRQKMQQRARNRGNDAAAATDPLILTGQCRYQDLTFYETFRIDFGNFYVATRASYEACERPVEPPHFRSPSGSEYWETDEGRAVIRCSDHWSNSCGLIATCWWTYDWEHHVPRRRLTGKCRYEDFSINGRRFLEVFFSHSGHAKSTNKRSNSIKGRYMGRSSGGLGRKLINDRKMKTMMLQPK